MTHFYERLGGTSSVSAIVISVAVMLISGFLLTRITKLLKLPNVTAYIVTGILIGPYVLDLIPQNVVDGMEFISDIALAFIAFSAGEYFKLSALKSNGTKVLIITLFESLTASVFVFVLTFFVLKLGLAFSVILSALASATAPASTLMTIRQTGAKGDFVQTLLGVVALDDVVSLLAYSVAVSVAVANLGNGMTAKSVILPIVYNIVLVAVGCLFGLLLKFLMTKKRSTDNRLIVSVAFLFAICGIGVTLDTSPLLACMAMGTVYINTTGDENLFKQLNYFSPPVLLLFFVRSGIKFDLGALTSTGGGVFGIPLALIGVLYFITRIFGKYVGGLVGCQIAKKPNETKFWFGFALFPQAGVAIGLSAMGARILGGQTGDVLLTVVLASSILYELVGPACAKLALYMSKSYDTDGETAPVVYKKEVGLDELKKRLSLIEDEIAKSEYARSDEEKAFLDATDEVITVSDYMKRKFINKR